MQHPPKHPLVNNIAFQTLISSVPGVFTVSFLPILIKEFDNFKFVLGVIYLTARFSVIISAPLIILMRHHNFRLNKILTTAEWVTALSIITAFFGISQKMINLTILAFAVRFVASNLIQVVRSSYLKIEYNAKNNYITLIFTNNITQIAYGLAGLLIILSHNPKSLTNFVLITDFITSMIGSMIFLRLPSSNWSYGEISDLHVKLGISDILKNHYKIILIDLAISIAFAGCNSLFIKISSSYPNSDSIYGLILTSYSASFVTATALLSSNSKFAKKIQALIAKPSLLAIIASCCALLLNLSPAQLTFCIFTLFFSYACFLSLLDKFWFETLPATAYPKWLAVRSSYQQAVWGVGEVIVTVLADTILARLVTCIAALLFARRTPLLASEPDRHRP